ncbi:MAG: hypothetical protein ACETWK_04330 [Candidatus Aminicenantaceae bacterium]
MKEIKLRYLAGIFLVSSATLCLEITLTRYFSISQDYHFAFLVVSIAFLGYGASGSFLTAFDKFQKINLEKFLGLSSFLYSLSIMACFLLCNSLSFDFIKLSWDKNQVYFIFIYYFLLSIPFFFAGLTISFAITKRAKAVNTIYFSDLIGAGIGSFLAILVFLPRGEKGVIVFISFLALLASLLFSLRTSSHLTITISFLLAAELALFIISPSWLHFRISPFKALPVALKYPQARHLLTKWNAISRVDVLDSPAVRYAPGLSLLYKKKLPPQLGLSVDGGDLTSITHFKNKEEPSLKFISYLPSSLAYSFSQYPSTLILEPKGGMDALAALFYKARKIKIIESNPLVVNLLQNELTNFTGSLYQKENIDLVFAKSRAALKQEKNKYDLIVFSLTDVFGSSGTGIYGFSENYLYTLESFVHLLKRLSPQGLISTTLYLIPPPRQEIRLLATWIEALEKTQKKPSAHIVAIRSWGTISYFIKNSPFTDHDIDKLKSFTNERLFDIVYYPGIKKEETNIHNIFRSPLYYDFMLQLLSLPSRKELYKNYIFEVRPATDNRPFFFNSYKLQKPKATYEALGKKWLPLLQGGFLIPLMFLQFLIIAFVLILSPLIVFRKSKSRRRGIFLKVFFYFSLIGMAFMFIEITWIQKFILFLGHPLYSISTIIFSLLLSTGIGSFVSKILLREKVKQKLKASLILCSFLIVIYLLFLPLFYQNLIHLKFLLKIVLTFLVIFPLGFLMGFPFPTGIRLLEREESRLIPWAWAANAFSSVINAVLALMIAFWGGYNLVLILAGGGYLLALPFLNFSNHGNKAYT